MTHLDEELVQRQVHAELRVSEREAVERHLSACATCQARVAEAAREDQWLMGVLERLDHPAPAITARGVITAAGHGRGALGRWAAGLLLLVGTTGVLYAMPGSPLRAWVAGVAQSLIAPRADHPPLPSEEPFPAERGIAVAPGARFVIQFAPDKQQGQLSLSLTPGDEVVIRSRGPGVTFTSEAGRLVVTNAGPAADFVVELPDDAPWIELRIGERRLALKQDRRLDLPADSAGHWTIPLQ